MSYYLLVTGYWLPASTGYELQATTYWPLATSYWSLELLATCLIYGLLATRLIYGI